jgi:hypothetical protein
MDITGIVITYNEEDKIGDTLVNLQRSDCG